MEAYLDFEKPLALLEQKLAELKGISKSGDLDLSSEILSLEKKVEKVVKDLYKNLSPWQRVQVSRHPSRPYARDYIDNLFQGFYELHGDRTFADDQALLGGIGFFNFGSKLGVQPVMILGQQKGRSTKQKMERNFGMARPEGYRKAMRLMDLAERARLPLLTLIDTPGAYPGLDAEERGQAQAIAESIARMYRYKGPSMAVVIGEGGSGGALAIGIADSVHMMEYSTYSVISPESCASILWNDSTLAEGASEKLRMSAKDLLEFKIIDSIIPEALGGAHRNWEGTFGNLARVIQKSLGSHLEESLKEKGLATLMEQRFQRYRALGSSALTSLAGVDTAQRRA